MLFSRRPNPHTRSSVVVFSFPITRRSGFPHPSRSDLREQVPSETKINLVPSGNILFFFCPVPRPAIPVLTAFPTKHFHNRSLLLDPQVDGLSLSFPGRNFRLTLPRKPFLCERMNRALLDFSHQAPIPPSFSSHKRNLVFMTHGRMFSFFSQLATRRKTFFLCTLFYSVLVPWSKSNCPKVLPHNCPHQFALPFLERSPQLFPRTPPRPTALSSISRPSPFPSLFALTSVMDFPRVFFTLTPLKRC